MGFPNTATGANTFPAPPAKAIEGQPLSAAAYNLLVAAIVRRITGDGKTLRARTFPDGQIIFEAIPPANTGTPVLERAQFVEEFDDYITVKKINGKPGDLTVSDTVVKVRKPYNLMRSVYEPDADFIYVDKTTRKYKDGDEFLEETQKIAPPYATYGPDMELTIARSRKGGEWIFENGDYRRVQYHEHNGEYARVWGLEC